MSEHETLHYDLTTPRQYTQHGGWNQVCECGRLICSHPDDCDCFAQHQALFRDGDDRG